MVPTFVDSPTATGACGPSCPLHSLSHAMDGSHIRCTEVSSGETICSIASEAHHVYFIRAGLVKLVKRSGTGRSRIVRIVKRDGVVGMEALFQSAYEHTAIAIGQVAACKVSATGLARTIRTDPSIKMRLLEYSHRVLSDVETWHSEFAGGNARSRARLARLLLHLRDGERDRIHCLSLEDTSALLGTTVETACRNLARLTKDGLLTKVESASSPRYYRADIAALEEIAYLENGAERRTSGPDVCARIPSQRHGSCPDETEGDGE